MRSQANRRGAGGLAVVVALVLLVVVGFGVWFFLSKPFQTHVREGYRQATEWTPERINADPVGYLTWASSEVAKSEEKLKASELSLETKMNGAERELSVLSTEKTNLEKLLADCKGAYLEASKSNKWPVEVRGKSFDEAMLKRKIVEWNSKLESTKSLIATHTKARDIFDRKKSEINDKLAEVSKLKNKLDTDLEIATVHKTVEGIGSIGDQVNAIGDTTQALVSTTEVTAEEMITPSGERRIDEEFQQIMGK